MKKAKLMMMAAAVCCAAMLPSLAIEVQAQVQHVNGNIVKCKLRWLPASKEYIVITVTESGRRVEQRWKPADIAQMAVAPPAGWQNVVKRASESPDAAIPLLRTIMSDYKMLKYDEEAARIAATIYLNKGQPEEAIKVCEEVTRDNPAAASVSVMAPVYWQSLVAADKTSRLEKMLDEAAVSAPRPIAAKALIARGDLLKKQNRPRDALKDGYLRVVFLLSNEKDAAAEALYKAAEAHDELHQTSYAEKMRQALLTRYSDSPYARKLRGGE